MANPVLNNFTEQERVLDSEPMTVNGTIQITAFLGILVVAAAAFAWSRYTLGYMDLAMMLTAGGLIVGFILAMIIAFTRIKYLIPVYAVCEGLFLGGISATFESSYPGIVSQAVAGTFAALFSMLILYRTNVIRCSDKFRSVIFIATFSIAAVYLGKGQAYRSSLHKGQFALIDKTGRIINGQKYDSIRRIRTEHGKTQYFVKVNGQEYTLDSKGNKI